MWYTNISFIYINEKEWINDTLKVDKFISIVSKRRQKTEYILWDSVYTELKRASLTDDDWSHTVFLFGYEGLTWMHHMHTEKKKSDVMRSSVFWSRW